MSCLLLPAAACLCNPGGMAFSGEHGSGVRADAQTARFACECHLKNI